MNQKKYLLIVGTVFSIVAILHLLRLVFGWEVIIEGRLVPLWLSVIFVVAGYLAYEGFRLSKKSK